jgi:NADH-quinone oxidoreductase subunit N
VPKIAYLSLLMTINAGDPLLIVGLISILVGSIGAINQTKIKRLLAYSAIGHVGFMLLGIGVATFAGIQATILYMIIYIIMTVQTFTVVISHKLDKLVELSGISRRNTIVGITLGIGLMSIAGVPPLAGFLNKYLIILSVIESNQIIYAIIAILISVISSFYYVRIIRFMFFIDKPTITSNPVLITSNQAIVLGITTYLIITLMFFPSILMDVSFPLTKA